MAGTMDAGGGSLPSNAHALAYLGATSLAGSGTANYDQADSVGAIIRNTTLSQLCMLNPARAFGAAGTVALDTPMRVLMVFDNTNATLYVNNTQIAQSTATFTLGSSGVIALGAAIGGTSGTLTRIGAHWYGKMAEVLVTNTALNSTERGQLDAYAAARLA